MHRRGVLDIVEHADLVGQPGTKDALEASARLLGDAVRARRVRHEPPVS